METERPVVLVADDDADMRHLLQRLLERAGFRVETAADGAAALARLALGGVDLVLADLMMPQVDGLEFCRRVRESEQARRIPILMLTGSVNAADRRAGFAYGADDYLLKPFRNQAVIDRVRAWTHSQPRAVEARGATEGGGAVVAPPAPAAGPALGRERPPARQPPSVLVVDDDPAVRELLRELLGAEGYRVTPVPHGHEALQRVGAHDVAAEQPGVILLDPGTPDGTGMAALRQLAGRASPVPVIAMSDSPSQLASAQAAGARATLAKPLDLLQLASLLERYCPISTGQPYAEGSDAPR